ncbi:MAG: tetratricopeptide repeat-containing sensor histidine kinase [Ignavibacteria bacterium]|nr:tetratricopeptide repeat-containing sensor histidine kinase [Ignavibacteria bacterium]
MNKQELRLLLVQAESESKFGNYNAVEKLCHEVLAELTVAEPTGTEMLLLHSHALRLFSESLWRRGRTSESLTFAQDALAISQQSKLQEEEAWSLGNIGNVYWSQSDFQTALTYYQKAVRLFEELYIPAGVAKYLGNIGTIERNFYDFPSALSTYQRALHLYESIEDKEGIAINLGNIGLVYKSLSDYSQAILYYQKALTMYEALEMRDGIARTLCNIGNLYRNLSDYPRALDYLHKGLAIFTTLNDKQGEATILSNIGNVYLSLSEYTPALVYHQRALAMNQELNSTSGIAKNLGNIGLVYTSREEYPKAMEYLNQALELNKELGRSGAVAGVLCNIGALHANQKYEAYNPTLAEHYLLEAISLNESLGIKQNLYESYLVLAELYRHTNQWDKFAYYFEKYHIAEKEVQNEQTKRLAERFDFERKIAAEHARLEEREAVVAELQSLNSSLQEANREKNEMLGIVAHDLKNPLTGILLSAESMKRFQSTMSDIDIDKRLTNILSAAEHMKAIILKLLDIQQLESGSFQLAPIPIELDIYIKESINRYSDQALTKKIAVQFQKNIHPTTILADSHALQEVIDNILSNALKFSPFESSISILVSTVRNERAQLSITDQGPGISAIDQTKLFEKFMQLSAKPTGGEHSSGLGLSIVKKLLDAMNGNIRCESILGHGASFIIELPLG